MKSFAFVFFVLFSLELHAEINSDFSYAMQDLTRYVACLGKYNYAEANLDWEPANFYTESMIAERLSIESGNRTVTHTFYGVCFDYANCALGVIEKSRSYYVARGMKSNCFYMADTADSGRITLADAGSKNYADRIQNGVPLRNIATKKVLPHKDSSGKRASNHAWVWVQRMDGIWFWLDPTWTDNLGYVVWGYVKDGEEIQLRPDRKFCVTYPNYLNRLPEAPEFQIEKSKSEETSNYRIEPNYFLLQAGALFCPDYNYLSKGGLRASLLGGIDWVLYINLPVEWEWDNSENGKSKNAFLFGIELGKQIVKFQNNKSIGLYGLGSIGCEYMEKQVCDSDEYSHYNYNYSLAYKVGGGVFLQLHNLVFNTDYSYSKTLGSSIGVSVAFGLGEAVSRKIE